MSQQKQLDLALNNLTREDPSLRVTMDAESGQTILSGMGELHLEVILERIRSEYKVSWFNPSCKGSARLLTARES